MAAGYSVRPILCGEHLEVRRAGKAVGNLLAPSADVIGAMWSLALAEPDLKLRTFETRELALKALGLSDAIREAA